MPGRTRLIHACAFAFYAALACVVTYPLVWHLTSAVPHDLGDPLLSTATLWWNAHVMPLTARRWTGFAFFPATGTIAFSDHRLGESLLATPMQWAGASAVTAYNLTLLATFPLCALGAHWLAFTLTRRHDAALLCGLAYGFNPYRMAHLEHLELLAAFGMPAALHLHARTRRTGWLVVFATALGVQALCSSYYALFFCMLLALWIPWFFRWADRPAAFAVTIACLCALAVIGPLAIGYTRIHQAYGFARTFTEVQSLSADLSSLVTASPLMMLWGWTSGLNGPERQLFPGATVSALALAGLRWPRRSGETPRDRLRVPFAALSAFALAFTIVGMSALWVGPWQLGFVTVRDAFKPFSIGIALLALRFAGHQTVREAFTRRAPYAFYLIATGILFVCSLGPTPTRRGAQILYRPPYAWLMHMPVFAYGVRAPARFAMPAILSLSVAAALAFARVPMRRARARLLLTAALATAIAAEGSIHGLALPAVPDGWPRAQMGDVVAVMSLPLGDPERDAATMYRATQIGARSVNGLSGYPPPHYVVLRLALAGRDPTAIEALAEHGPLLIAIEKHEDRDQRWTTFLSQQPGVTAAGNDERWTMFRLARREMPAGAAGGHSIPIVAAADNRGSVDVATLTDNDPETGWLRPEPQFKGETLRVDVGRAAPLSAVVLSLGSGGELYPRTLSISTSADDLNWATAFSGKIGGRAFRAVLENPRDARLEFSLGSTVARFIRLRLEQSDQRYPWIVTDVVVKGE